MPAPGRTPLARLHDTARRAGIIVVDGVDDDGPLLDDGTAAFVACGVCIAVSPGLGDGLRADVLAMALALTYSMGPPQDRPSGKYRGGRRLRPDQPNPRSRAFTRTGNARDGDRPRARLRHRIRCVRLHGAGV